MRKLVRGVVLQQREMGLLSGPLADPDVEPADEKDLKISWSGRKFPAKLLRQILSFFHWVYKEHNTEATARLFFNPEAKDDDTAWEVAVLPQEICIGLSAKELGSSEKYNEIISGFLSRGLISNGTIHSHCDAGAFQSSTDTRDERPTPGLHITLGHLNHDVADIHARFTMFGLVYAVDMKDWFPVDKMDKHLSVSDLPDFPEEWKASMTKVVKTPVLSGGIRPPCAGGNPYKRYGSDKTTKTPPPLSWMSCRHMLIPSVDAENLIKSMYEGLVDGVKEMDICNTRESAQLSGLGLQYLIAGAIAIRTANSMSDPEFCARYKGNAATSSIISSINKELDDFNPSYELMAGADIASCKITLERALDIALSNRWLEETEVIREKLLTEDVIEEFEGSGIDVVAKFNAAFKNEAPDEE